MNDLSEFNNKNYIAHYTKFEIGYFNVQIHN